MNSVIVNALFFAAISGILCLPFLFQKRKKWRLFLVFLVSVFVAEVLLNKAKYLNVQFDLDYNWAGKILAMLFALLLIYGLKRWSGAFHFGLTLKQRRGSLKPVLKVVLILSIIEMLVIYFYFRGYDADPESHLFQSVMPGISEEIIYRGLYLGILNRIFTGRKNIFGANMGYGAVVTCIMFALCHGLGIDSDFNITFPYQNMLVPLVFGTVWVWMRERTGSILIPVLFHNFSNEIGLIIMDFKS